MKSKHAVKTNKTKKVAAKTPPVPVKGGLKKQYSKSGSTCRIFFRLPREAAPNAGTVMLVGDFNNWNTTETQMKRLKNGDYQLSLTLPCKREYRFRYLIDNCCWENDWCADKYIPNRFGCDDSVVVV